MNEIKVKTLIEMIDRAIEKEKGDRDTWPVSDYTKGVINGMLAVKECLEKIFPDATKHMVECKDCIFCNEPDDYRDGEAECDRGRILTQKGDYLEDNWHGPRPKDDDCTEGIENRPIRR